MEADDEEENLDGLNNGMMLDASNYLMDAVPYYDEDINESSDGEGHTNVDINLEIESSEHIKQDTGEENSNSSMNMSIFAIQMC